MLIVPDGSLRTGNYSVYGNRYQSQTCSSCSLYANGKWRLAVYGQSLEYEAKVASSEPPLSAAGWTVKACGPPNPCKGTAPMPTVVAGPIL